MNNLQYFPAIRRSVIDVGTNSVKVLIADVKDESVMPIEEKAIQTRLGEGLNNSGVLNRNSIEKTLEAIQKFVELSKSLGVSRIRIIGTSAVRESANSDELVKMVKEKFGLLMEIISGEKEAEFVYEGVVCHLRNEKTNGVLISDIGGGSSEFIYGIGERIEFVKYYPFGTVRYMNEFKISDPPKQSEYSKCRERIYNDLNFGIINDLNNISNFNKHRVEKFIATGGTITILGRILLGDNEFNRERLENLEIKFGDIKKICDNLWSLPLQERKKINGLPPDRADVILFGALLYASLMEGLKLDSVFVSTRGLRFGAIKKF